MLAQSLLVVLAGLEEVSTYICAYCIEHACNLLQCHGLIKKYVSEEFFIFFCSPCTCALGRFNHPVWVLRMNMARHVWVCMYQ